MYTGTKMKAYVVTGNSRHDIFQFGMFGEFLLDPGDQESKLLLKKLNVYVFFV